jgi:hypothetical protein
MLAFQISASATTLLNGSFESPDATAGNVGLPGVLLRPFLLKPLIKLQLPFIFIMAVMAWLETLV